MKINPLVATLEDRADGPKDLRSCINAHGLYSTLQFVLRLSPEIHRVLSTTPSGIYSGSNISFESIQAFSTFLHETIHWWQHIGSTSGLILSLSHPVQSHANYTHLKTFLREVGPKKSILRYGLSDGGKAAARVSDEADRTTNVIVNNYKDVSFYQTIATRPDLIPTHVANDPHFENVGHSYYITYANTLRLLTSLFDPDFTFLPDPRTWEPYLDKLKEDKEQGFYYGSPVAIPPIGLRELFEGQARFIQLQYLHFGTNERFDWDDANDFGMMSDIYVSAFRQFLQLTESEWPGSIRSPLVGLFLAVCDIALNSGEGFPLPLVSPASFVTDNDPGTRFTFLCRLIALKAPDLKRAITSYSTDEYVQVTERVSKLLMTPSPLKIASQMVDWSLTKPRLIELMEEDRLFKFSAYDMPARLLFGRYINFCRDKAVHPELLCWPGAWFAGQNISEHAQVIFDRNQALFVDKEDNDGIFPAVLPGKDQNLVHETFNRFYGWIVNYELVSQWIAAPGPFVYDYEWLSQEHDRQAVKAWANRGFEHVFGVSPDTFEIV